MAVKEIAENIFLWMQGGSAPPVKIHLFTTVMCNLRCLSCWTRSMWHGGEKPRDPELSDERLLAIVDEAIAMGVKEIELCGGGEPFFRKEVAFAIVEKIKAAGLQGNATTNATLFTEDEARRFVEIGWEQLIISLDGPNAAINDYLRPPVGTFDKVTRFLGWIKHYKELHSKSYPEVIIQCVLSNKNISDIVSLFELAGHYKVNKVMLEPVKVFSELGKDLAITTDAEYEIIKGQLQDVTRIASNYGISTNFFSLCEHSPLVKESGSLSNFLETGYLSMKSSNNKSAFFSLACYEPWYRMYITNFGFTSFCCAAEYSSEENIMDKSLKDIWYGERFNLARQSILTGKLPLSCNACNACLVGQTQAIQEELQLRFN